MSTIGSPLETSLLQAAQAQQTASKNRDSERASSERGRRLKDLVELRVAGLEQAAAVRALPANDSEEGEQDREQRGGSDPGPRPEDERPRIDVQA